MSCGMSLYVSNCSPSLSDGSRYMHARAPVILVPLYLTGTVPTFVTVK